MKLSVVVPILNEEHNIRPLHEQIVRALDGVFDYEVIFVNDGSTDGSREMMRGLYPLTVIDFRKRFGQTAALDAGFKRATGELVVALDGDLQNNPADIPRMLAYLQAHDLDVVSGWRKSRQDTLVKRFVSRGANALRRILIGDGIHDSGCTLKVYRAECLDGLDLYGEMHRFIPALLKIRGFSVGELVVEHRPRVADTSKYGFSRTAKGFLDMLSVGFWDRYASRPLHLFGGVGLVLIAVSVPAGFWAMYLKFFRGVDLSNTFLSHLSLYGLLMGMLFLVFGLLADMLAKVYFSQVKRTPYTIKSVETNRR